MKKPSAAFRLVSPGPALGYNLIIPTSGCRRNLSDLPCPVARFGNELVETVEIRGLGQVIVKPRVERGFDIRFLPIPAQRDQPHACRRRVVTNATGEVEAVQLW